MSLNWTWHNSKFLCETDGKLREMRVLISTHLVHSVKPDDMKARIIM